MTNPMVYACLMGGLRHTPYFTGEITGYGLDSLLNMRLHVRAAIPRLPAIATHSIHPAALFGRAVGTILPQPACSPKATVCILILSRTRVLYFQKKGCCTARTKGLTVQHNLNNYLRRGIASGRLFVFFYTSVVDGSFPVHAKRKVVSMSFTINIRCHVAGYIFFLSLYREHIFWKLHG